jgi:hypothetical protein
MKAIGTLLLMLFALTTYGQANTKPEIHGPDIYGAKPNRPFLFKIPATGAAPITFEMHGIPPGLQLDNSTGILSGSVPSVGIFQTIILAKNSYGTDTLFFDIHIGPVALTPPMGWNSWNVFGLRVTDKDIRNAADVIVSSGLINHGWTYINIDDGWESAGRLPNGEIAANDKFPDMVALSDYIHSKGLKFGIYSSPGPKTCGGYLGSLDHEEQDIKTYEKWGVDYLKYDLCSYVWQTKGLKKKAIQAPYILMNKFIQNSSRDIVYSLCQYGLADVWEWGKEVGGNSWRTTGDIVDTWASVQRLLNKQKKLAPYAEPGHWNDPDMLVLGVVGWNDDSRKCRLTEDEQRLHFTMWSMLSSPLLLGCDLTKIDPFTMSLITNDDIIALNQDRLGKQAVLLEEKGNIQVWKKELADGSFALAFCNLGKKGKFTTYDLAKATTTTCKTSKDLWTVLKTEVRDNKLTVAIPTHGVVVVKLK